MGSFESYYFSGGTWTKSPGTEPWLSIELHDSDFATVRYAPASEGGGLFYVGYQPRFYFEKPNEGFPVDVSAEAYGIAQWVKEVVGASVDPVEVVPLIADDEGTEPEDVFVEETLSRLLAVLRLPDFGVAELSPSVSEHWETWVVQRHQRLEADDDLDRSRVIEHLASFPSRVQAVRAATELERLGFSVVLARSFFRVLLKAIRTETLSDESVLSFLEFTVVTVEENGGRYEGFSDAVVDQI